MTGWELDIDRLYTDTTGWVPFSVRYGYRKISDFAARMATPYSVPGTLWERVAS